MLHRRIALSDFRDSRAHARAGEKRQTRNEYLLRKAFEKLMGESCAVSSGSLKLDLAVKDDFSYHDEGDQFHTQPYETINPLRLYQNVYPVLCQLSQPRRHGWCSILPMDGLLGNAYGTELRARFEHPLGTEDTDPDGSIFPIRSELTGFTIRVPSLFDGRHVRACNKVQ
ncbi:hypothetical protein CLCR_03159 [Cladophialophora carrionii]|uniref:Uncharacterized protein n=1 Tax=Cladophialophora carrionii TaxID=86049 RepID=A0A1C1D2T7_9EURO|nr:hypothetical protein CLCR_03159 [Cladophialophora carrionii]